MLSGTISTTCLTSEYRRDNRQWWAALRSNSPTRSNKCVGITCHRTYATLMLINCPPIPGQVMYLLRPTYYLCKERDPLRHFSNLCHLSEMQGLPLGTAYRNGHAAHDFAMAISTATMQQWLPHARSSVSIGLMMDESTTVSSEGTLILYLRFLMRGQPTTKFWKLLELPDGKAATIVKAVEIAFAEDELDPRRIQMISTDGANVMLGSESGVTTQLRAKVNIFMLIVHCIAHRGALAVGDACEGNEVAEQFERLLRDILHFFKDSTLRKSKLCALQEQLGVHELRLLKIHAIRWLSRAAASRRIHHNFGPLVFEFRQETDMGSDTAGVIWRTMVTHSFIVCLCGFTDILNKLAILSQAFQTRIVRFFQVSGLLKALTKALTAAYGSGQITMGGALYQQLSDDCSASRRRADRSNVENLANTYTHRGVVIQYDRAGQQTAEASVRKLAMDVISKLNDRFPDEPLLMALEIFDLVALPATFDEWDQQRALYGRDEVGQLMEHYGKPQTSRHSGVTYPALVRPDIFRNEWELFREKMAEAWYTYLASETPTLSASKREEARRAVIVSFYAIYIEEDRFPEVGSARLSVPVYVSLPHPPTTALAQVTILASIWLIEVLSSVECERGFSLMNLIKTKLSNRMNVATLDARLQVAANGPPIQDHAAVEAILEAAYAIWVSSCKRNIRKSHPGVAGRKPKANRPSMASMEAELGSVGRDRADDMDAAPHVVRTLRGDDSGEEGDLDDGNGAEGTHGVPPPTQAELYASVAPFAPASEETVLPPPESTFDPTTFNWVRRRVAHKFDDGWYRGTYRRTCPSTAAQEYIGKHEFFYQGKNSKGEPYRTLEYHEFPLDEYGMDKLWVIVEVPFKPRGGSRLASVPEESATGSTEASAQVQKESTEMDKRRQRRDADKQQRGLVEQRLTQWKLSTPNQVTAKEIDAKRRALAEELSNEQVNANSAEGTEMQAGDAACTMAPTQAAPAPVQTGPKRSLPSLPGGYHAAGAATAALFDSVGLGRTRSQQPDNWQTPPAAARAEARYAAKLDHAVPLPDECLIVVVDYEHTGAQKGETLLDQEIWEKGAFTLRFSRQAGTIRTEPRGSISTFVNSTKKMAVYSQGLARQAGATPDVLRNADALNTIVESWLQELGRAATLREGGKLPIVIAAHDCFAVDAKLLYWGMLRAGMQPFARLAREGVIGFMDTRRIAKLLPSHMQRKLIAPGKPRPSFDNKALFEAFVPTPAKWAVMWHQAFDDARATAAWLSSDEFRTVLCRGELGDSLVSLAQVVLMVHAKYAEGQGTKP